MRKKLQIHLQPIDSLIPIPWIDTGIILTSLLMLTKYIKSIICILSSNFGFSKSGGQSLTNTDTHITHLEKPKLADNIQMIDLIYFVSISKLVSMIPVSIQGIGIRESIGCKCIWNFLRICRCFWYGVFSDSCLSYIAGSFRIKPGLLMIC